MRATLAIAAACALSSCACNTHDTHDQDRAIWRAYVIRQTIFWQSAY